jgi:hypothetical protein
MSPDLYFALTLIVKMAVTAAFLLAATITAERAGPLIGGLVATLPISAGPVYIFLALDHDAHFIAQSALGSLVTNAYNVIFALTYALLAQRHSLAVSFGTALALWIALMWMGAAVPWTAGLAVLFNSVVIGSLCGFRHRCVTRRCREWKRVGMTSCCVPRWSLSLWGSSWH